MSKGGEGMKAIGNKYLKKEYAAERAIENESICISLDYLNYLIEEAVEDCIGLISQQVRERIKEQQNEEKE